MSQRYILPLAPMDQCLGPQVGAKAYNLSLLMGAGFETAPGFVVPTDALMRFMRHNHMTRALESLSVRPDLSRHQGRQAAAEARRIFDAALWPGDLESALQEAYLSLVQQRPDLKVVARSSFAGEDGQVSSFAGQMATVMDIGGFEALKKAVVTCWTSQWGLSSLVYRSRRGEDHSPGGAVLVQRQLEPSWSGVLFAASPAGPRDLSLIEALPRTKSGVVDGVLDPHRLLINPGDGAIRLYRKPDRDTQVMADDVQALVASQGARLVRQGAAHQLGDFEWAVSDALFYVLQGRPMTTSDPEASPPQDDTVWSRVLGDQFWSGTVTPLMFSTVGAAIESAMIRRPIAHLGAGYLSPRPYLSLIHDHVFVNLTALESIAQLIPEWMLSRDILDLFPADQADRIKRHAGLVLPVDLLEAVWHFYRDGAPWWFPRAARDFDRFVDATVAPLMRFRPPSPASSPASFSRSLDDLMTHLEDFLYTAVWGVTYAYVFVPLARNVLNLWFDAKDRERLTRTALSNLPGDKNFDSSRILGELAVKVRQLPCYERLDADATFDRNRALLSKTPGGKRFLKDFQALLDDHGHRAVDRDILYPRWADRPAIPFSLVMNLSRRQYTPPSMPATEAEVWRELERHLPIRWLNLFAPFKLPSLKVIVALARRFLPVRENTRFYADVFLHALRKIALARGQGLVAQGLLRPDEVELVFFFTRQELFSVGEVDKTMVETARRRRQRFLANRCHNLPDFLFNGEDYQALGEHQEPGDVIPGLPASPGVGRGAVRLVLSYEDFFAFRAGEVLIVPNLDPSWSSLIPSAAAVVTEVGGQLSHGAIIAREFGVPAVVGVKGITRVVENGQRLAVNGTRGQVIIPAES